VGWTAGAGVEVAMTDNWTAKVEYLAVGFERASAGSTSRRGRFRRVVVFLHYSGASGSTVLPPKANLSIASEGAV
jgi:opacity protein-like surface antigen